MKKNHPQIHRSPWLVPEQESCLETWGHVSSFPTVLACLFPLGWPYSAMKGLPTSLLEATGLAAGKEQFKLPLSDL